MNVEISDLHGLYNRSDWGLLELTGGDRLRFLHNQSTNQIMTLQPGQSCETVFVNSTGRTLDLVTVYVKAEAVWLLVSPNRREFLWEWMDRYIFPMDDVELKDISTAYGIFTLVGDQSRVILENLGYPDLPTSETHIQSNYQNQDLLIAEGSGLEIPGYTLIVPQELSKSLESKFNGIGIPVSPYEDWEKLRILQGRPAAAKELTEDYNPLEAGLWRAISFDKGCYIGQETIARLNTYKGVKQRLWGILTPRQVEVGTPIMQEDKKVGVVTSATEDFALGYIKTQAGGEGSKVHIGNTTGEVVPVAYLSHTYYQ